MDDILAEDLQYTYSKLPNLVIGFHGCEQESFDNVIMNMNYLRRSVKKLVFPFLAINKFMGLMIFCYVILIVL